LTIIGAKGCASIVLNKYNNRFWTIMLGLQQYGSYVGTYTLCSGNREHKDGNCFIASIMREMSEEFKIHLNMTQFEQHFADKNGKIRYFLQKKTPVFVGVFQGLSRKPLNAEILHCNNTPGLPIALKEFSRVEWFNVVTLQQIEGYQTTLSIFAQQVIPKIKFHNL